MFVKKLTPCWKWLIWENSPAYIYASSYFTACCNADLDCSYPRYYAHEALLHLYLPSSKVGVIYEDTFEWPLTLFYGKSLTKLVGLPSMFYSLLGKVKK